jgi:hypothetical protein
LTVNREIVRLPAVVAISRSSDKPSGSDKGRGVNAFKDYLEFCSSGVMPDRGSLSNRDMESPFEEAVASVIARMGLEVLPQVGVAGYFIDRDPGKHVAFGDFTQKRVPFGAVLKVVTKEPAAIPRRRPHPDRRFAVANTHPGQKQLLNPIARCVTISPAPSHVRSPRPAATSH